MQNTDLLEASVCITSNMVLINCGTSTYSLLVLQVKCRIYQYMLTTFSQLPEKYSESAAKLFITALKNHHAKYPQIFRVLEEGHCVQCQV